VPASWPSSAFYQQRRADALTAWFHLCWRAPEQAAEALDNPRQPDTGIKALWQRFMDSEEESPRSHPPTSPPGCCCASPASISNSPSSSRRRHTRRGHYRCVHRWIDARRAKRTEEEIALRKMLQAHSPALFRQLKLNV
jgi:hypothetical protein